MDACRIIGACLLFTSALSTGTQAQAPASSADRFSLSGSSSLTAYYSNHQIYSQDIPPQYLSWHLRSRLSLFGLPLNLSALVSTQQHPGKQSMNHFSLGMDMRSLTRRIQQTDRLRFMRRFETLEIGRTRPAYSALMLSGVPVNGVNTAVSFGWLHAAFVYGKSQRPVGQGIYLAQQYRQKMIFGQLGAGDKGRSFFRLSVLHSKDDENSIIPVPDYYYRRADTLVHFLDTLFIPADTVPVFRKPSENLLPGLELGTRLFNKRLSIQGEIVGSINTSNTRSASVSITDLPEWTGDIQPVRLTTSVSYAAQLKSELNLGTTRISGSYRMVTPGFSSPGTAFMRQDYLSYEVRINQALMNRKLLVQPHYRWFHDNLSGQKKGTTYTLIWGMNVMWRPEKLPYLSINVVPHRQELKLSQSDRVNKALVLTVGSGKNYMIGEQLSAFTGINWSTQQTSMATETGEQQFKGNNISLQQSLRFPIRLLLTAQMGYYYLSTQQTSSTSYQYALHASYRPNPSWNVEAGIRHMNRNGEQKRYGFQLLAAYDSGRMGEIRLSAEPVYYRDVFNPEREYDQYIIRLSLINRW